MSVLIIDEGTDRQSWLTKRRSAVTATDIARLANGGPAAWAAVKAEKLGAENTFRGNAYTRWGHERESYIAAHVEFLTGITPNTAFYINGARGATPDGVSATKNGEYKTTTTDWEQNVDAIPPRYRDQSLWAQLVREVDETVFAWEPHENFIPGPIRTLTIPRDEQRITELLEIEERFWAYLDDTDIPGEFDDLIAAAAERKHALDEATAAYDDVLTRIRERAGDREISARTPFGSISLAWPKPRTAFSSTDLKKDHPDLYEQYMKSTPPSKPTLRVTV